MSSNDALLLYDCCRAEVAELLDAHADFDVVEGAIDGCALDRDEKDALWLWASAPRPADRRPVGVPDHHPAARAEP
jgi:hypothetical protein